MKRMFLVVLAFLILAGTASAAIVGIEKNPTKIVYEVAKGDTCWEIQEFFYKERTTWKNVKERVMVPNGITRPRKMAIGTILVLHGSELDYLIPTERREGSAKVEAKGLDREVFNKMEALESKLLSEPDRAEIKSQLGSLEKAVQEERTWQQETQKKIEELEKKIAAIPVPAKLARNSLVIAIISIGLAILALIFAIICIGRDKSVLARNIMLLLALMFLGCAGPKMVMQNVNSGVSQVDVEKHSMLLEPHQTLGIRPTQAIREGNISVFEAIFPLILSGEYFPGRLVWLGITIEKNGTEHFSQYIFSGMSLHYSQFHSTIVVDGKVPSGQTAAFSTAMDYIYSPVGKELAIEKARFLLEPAYRTEKVREVNTDKDGNVLDISSLPRINGFQEVIKSWNQIETPDGNLISPYGVEEVAKIRGINPQYTYFQKLVGTGKFRINPVPDVAGFAIVNSIGVLMDLIGAGNAPTTGWDYNSELPSRRNAGYQTEYFTRLALREVWKRDRANYELVKQIQAQGAPRRLP